MTILSSEIVPFPGVNPTMSCPCQCPVWCLWLAVLGRGRTECQRLPSPCMRNLPVPCTNTNTKLHVCTVRIPEARCPPPLNLQRQNFHQRPGTIGFNTEPYPDGPPDLNLQLASPLQSFLHLVCNRNAVRLTGLWSRLFLVFTCPRCDVRSLPNMLASPSPTTTINKARAATRSYHLRRDP